jgi:hypothetical protein
MYAPYFAVKHRMRRNNAASKMLNVSSVIA